MRPWRKQMVGKSVAASTVEESLGGWRPEVVFV
jgi:hypothetical protein